jgi:tRNA(Arg) A34 adenosine deaminase TadA
MAFVIELARHNVANETGGPFGAAVFDLGSGRVLAAGVNVVVPAQCSSAHAEVVALSLAQKALNSHDLGAAGLPACELVTSTEPCAMCLGALVWSGVRSMVCGARDADARALGFDEGPKPADWQTELLNRGIEVSTDVHRVEAADVLRDYVAAGRPVYNGRAAP